MNRTVQTSDETRNFEILNHEDRLVIHCRRSGKDWFDLALATFIATVLSVFTGFIIRYAIKVPSFMVIIIALVAAAGTLFKLTDALSKLLAATRSVITVDKNTKTLRVKTTIFTFRSIAIDQVHRLLVNGQRETLRYGGGRSAVRFFCQISVQLADKSAVTLITINPTNFFRSDDNETQADLRAKAKKLAEVIGACLDLKYQWTGFKDS